MKDSLELEEEEHVDLEDALEDEQMEYARDHRSYSQPGLVTKNAAVTRTHAWTRSRVLALLAVCTMSVGSHYGMFLLGPLKSRLHTEMGTSNSQFSLLITSFNLNSTWTPLIGGIFVSRFGTAWSSVATTGCVLAGQLILLIGVMTEHLLTMVIGLFIFGIGLTPLTVVQETLVSHLSPSNNLGISLAAGLVFGKSSSFISSIISLPLADKFGDSVPFLLAVGLCLLSFLGNLARLSFGWGRDIGEAKVEEKRRIQKLEFGAFGDVYWSYILLNVFAGSIWQPFLHLSANLVQHRYNVSEQSASTQASILLAGPIILYPLVGHLTDRFTPSSPRTTFYLITQSTALTLLCYTFLRISPEVTHTPWPGLILFGLGYGSATLLFVILVPKFLPPHLIPLGLGIHKSMEMAASSLSQTLSGIWLDVARGDDTPQVNQEGATSLLSAFWIINLLELVCVLALWIFEWSRRTRAASEGKGEYIALSGDATDSGQGELGKPGSIRDSPKSGVSSSREESARGKISFYTCVGFVAFVWVVFLITAWHDL